MTDEPTSDALWVEAEEPFDPDGPEDDAIDADLDRPRRGPARPPRRDRPSDRFDDDDHDDDWDDDWDDEPIDTKLPRWVLVVGGIVVVIGLLAGGVMWWYNRQLDPPGPPGDEVAVQIPRGASTSGIGSILERNDVVPNSMVFNFYASRKGAGPFEAGAYVFQENSSVDLALEVLEAGPDPNRVVDTQVVKLTIPEGLTVEEIIARTNKALPRMTIEDLDEVISDGTVTSSLLPADSSSFEGLLFPATYDIGPERGPEDVLGLLADEMHSRVAGFGPDTAVAELNQRYGLDLTTYDVLKVASMVQAEAGSADEAPKIATVIYNRLAEKSSAYTLGIDAVDEFGAEQLGIDVTTFRAEHTDSPYNTRSVAGLPPTPIGAPGDYALSAAFNPAEGPWMYYVLTDPGVHTFAETDAEFQAAKQICIRKNLGCGP